MPTVAIVEGVKIEFYYEEHPPPHFHVKHAEYRATVLIDTLEIVKGDLPRSKYRKVVAWAMTRKAVLDRAWHDCRSDMDPGKIT
jgi:hypothetical protein